MKPKSTKRKKVESVPNLRPPTMMIDLLFGALMLFAFQMGAPPAKTVIPHDVDLPTSSSSSNKEPAPLLALRPTRNQSGLWQYTLPDGRILNSKDVAQHIKKFGKTPVLLVSRGYRVQDYVDAEQPLRKAGLKAGLAVEISDGEKK
jgi:hypothetical protein